MGERNRYQRIFLIFNQEDSGFGAGQEPSGYAKIEVLENKGRLSTYIQNLKDEPARLDYKLYLLKCDDKQVKSVYAGNLNVKNNKGELLWGFEPGNVGKTGNHIEQFNVAVILAEYKDRGKTGIICPLAAYKKEKIEWREKLRKVLVLEKHRDSDDGIQDKTDLSADDVYSKYTGGVESKYQPDKKSNVIEISFKKEDEPKTPDIQPDDTLATHFEKNNAENEKADEKKIDSEAGNEKINEEERTEQEGKSEEDNQGDFEDMREYEKMIESSIAENSGQAGVKPEEEGAYPGCNMNSPFSNTSCEGCKAAHGREEAVKSQSGLSGLDRLKKDLDMYFEIYTPFATRRRDYKWWKINSPVHLNNILYQCNIKTPLLFNPKVMMAHFKYRYIIVGIFTDRIRRREYIVCGVPGVYGVDDKAFGDACRWVQVEGSRPKYGAFGYWIIYIDPKSGKLLSAN